MLGARLYCAGTERIEMGESDTVPVLRGVLSGQRRLRGKHSEPR